MKGIASIACALAAVTLAQPALAKRTTEKFTSLTVIGDSLVDAGNIRNATGGAVPKASDGYVDGRFTNGYDYTDLLNQALFGSYTTASTSGGRNFAFGGARIVTNADTVPDLSTQLALLRAIGQAVDPNGLYVMTLGGNDIFAVDRGEFGTSATATDAYLRAAAKQYAAGVQTLNDRGARNIFLTDFPVAASAFNAAANGYLKDELGKLTLAADTTLYQYSLADFLGRVTANPAAFNLPPLDLTTTCIQAKAQASGCAGYFSFDGTHPTAAIQAAAYRDINARFDLTGSVPEPATWAMMILGFGAIGMGMRRRVRVAIA